MDKNTIIGFLLIGIVLIVFTWLNQPTPEQIEAQRRMQDSIARIEYAKQLEQQKELNREAKADDELAGLPDSVRLARLQNTFGVFADAMVGEEGSTVLENELIEVRLANKGGRIGYVRLKKYDNYKGEPLVLFDEKDSKFDFTLVTADNRVVNTGDLYFTPVKGNDRNSITMRLNTGEGSHLDFMYTLKPDDYMLQFSIKGTGLNGVLSPGTTALDLLWQQKITQQEKGRKFEDRYATVYYKFMVNQYFVIPLFNFLGQFIHSYGLLIFLLTVIVKLILFPLTYKSYMSSAKMRVLRPQVEELNAKYPGQDKAVERQRAIMELYSRAGASPMAGCVPMLLQMPILVALFMFFPSAIELRHQSFLWAHDLSTYDAIVSWNTYIPIITPYFGNHISLFCLLMTVTNIIYTKFNMDQTNTGQQQMPGMKAMMYMMPLMMLVFFNQYASGLTYYYFISTLITILQTVIFRYTINEDKLLAKLEENKKKPMKKSGFMKRLEEAQKAQQAQLERQKQQRENNRRR